MSYSKILKTNDEFKKKTDAEIAQLRKENRLSKLARDKADHDKKAWKAII